MAAPSLEFTRGIDDWIFLLTMPDYALPAKVKKARHALSLDDERDAFWPLLWDEVIGSGARRERQGFDGPAEAGLVRRRA